MASDIPAKMRRLVVQEPGTDVATCKIEIEEVDVPVPKSGELLIRVVAAPINPSDYGEWYKSNPSRYPLPMGKEGCGIVVQSGGGLSSYRFSVGAKVGFINLKGGQGSYSEYVTASAASGCFSMPDDVPIEDCASFFVNPYTALGIIDTAKNAEGSPAFVHTAAASQLGQMIVKLAPDEDVDVINVVRRQEQADILKKLGAEHIVVTGSATDDESVAKWKDVLKTKIKDLDATCAFDAVSGRMTGDILDCLPPKGALYTYGSLAGPAGNINTSDLIYRQKRLKGFFLTTWIREGGMLSMVPRMLRASGKVNAGLKGPGGWSSTQFEDTTMEKAHADIVRLLGGSATGKKLRVRFEK